MLNKEFPPDYWNRMGLAGRPREATEKVVKEKETIKETIIKEVVMIPCKYCSGLMPQTSVFCPNCGARRTA
jgi:hypothetical protein